MDRDKPLATLAKMDEWEARVAEIDASIHAQTEERALLIRKIDAAKVLAEDLPLQKVEAEIELPASAEKEIEEVGEDSAAHEILLAVSAMGGAPKPALIRRWIRKHNPALSARLDAHPQYLYTALMRHVRRGRLAKRGNGYRVPPSSLKKGAGGVVTPSDDIHFTPNDMRAAETAPEAGGI